MAVGLVTQQAAFFSDDDRNMENETCTILAQEVPVEVFADIVVAAAVAFAAVAVIRLVARVIYR